DRNRVSSKFRVRVQYYASSGKCVCPSSWRPHHGPGLGCWDSFPILFSTAETNLSSLSAADDIPCEHSFPNLSDTPPSAWPGNEFASEIKERPLHVHHSDEHTRHSSLYPERLRRHQHTQLPDEPKLFPTGTLLVSGNVLFGTISSGSRSG